MIRSKGASRRASSSMRSAASSNAASTAGSPFIAVRFCGGVGRLVISSMKASRSFVETSRSAPVLILRDRTEKRRRGQHACGRRVDSSPDRTAVGLRDCDSAESRCNAPDCRRSAWVRMRSTLHRPRCRWLCGRNAVCRGVGRPWRHQNRALHLRELAHSCDSPGVANNGLVAGRTNHAAELPIDSCSSRAQERRRAQSPAAKWVTGTPTRSSVTSRLNSQSNVGIRDHFVASAPTDNLGHEKRLHFASAVEPSPKVQRRQGRRETRARHAEVWV